MLYMERWKVILIAVAAFFSLFYAAPNVMDRSTRDWIQANLPIVPHQIVNLGLDLRGGSHLLLEVATDSFIDEKYQGLVDQTRSELRTNKIGYTDLGYSRGSVRFKLTDPSQADKVKQAVREIDRDLEVSIDKEAVSFQLSESSLRDRKRAAVDQSIEIVRRRIDETGTREPSIQRQGENRILVQLPGLDDPERIKRLLGQTAKLTFRLVDELATNDPGSVLPAGTERLPSTERDGMSYVVQKRIMVSGDTLVDAQPSFQDAQPVVSFKFDSVGGKRFGEATRANVNRLFAIVLDNKIISAPVIREPIMGGSGVISGHFTTQSAQDLALLLRAGALPAPIKILEERTVGPGLGEDSIHAGAIASVVGLVLVVVFFVLSYGLFGIFANLALCLNLIMIFAILSALQATLTLPGIAGIVLTMGTALDANVLIFERIREEMRLGRSAISSIDAGFKRAWSAIMDANTTTLIAAFLMFAFGSGPVKGFAVTMTIGILTSIFTAILVTRFIIFVWYSRNKPKLLPL